MIYLYWYLGIGIVVLAVVFGAHLMTEKKIEEGSLSALLEAANADRKRLSYRLLHDWALPMLAAIALVVVWPVAIYMKIKEICEKRKSRLLPEGASLGDLPTDEMREFVVERRFLEEHLTVQQIEAREVVADPLGAVSGLPFGHLNAAWRAFVDCVESGDELWSFTAPWQTQWGRKEIRAGYVIVRGGAPAAYFLTLWKDIEEQPDGGQGASVAGASTHVASRS